MGRILNSLRIGRRKYPRIQYDIRGEEISYSMPDKKLNVAWTHIDGQRIYTDSIDKWDNDDNLTNSEKSAAFSDIISYIKEQTKENVIVIINSDVDKAFWESECEKLKTDISLIEHTSNKQKDEFLYQMFLESIPVTIDGIKIDSKEALDNYWLTRKNKIP